MFNTSTSVQKPSGNSAPRVDYGPVSQGQHVGRIVRVTGMGLQETANQFNPDSPPATVFQVTVELPNERIDVTDKDGNTSNRPRWIWSKDIPVKFFEDFDTGVTKAHDKSKLNELLSAAFPEHTNNWTVDKVKEYFPKLIGKDISIFVTHSQSKKTGKTYDNIKQFIPVMKGMVVGELENETLYYDPYNHDQAEFDKLSNFAKERINNRLDKEAGQVAPQQEPAPEPQYEDDVPF